MLITNILLFFVPLGQKICLMAQNRKINTRAAPLFQYEILVDRAAFPMFQKFCKNRHQIRNQRQISPICTQIHVKMAYTNF